MTPPSPPILPAGLRATLEALRRVARPLLVGGCVRDWLAGRAPKDFDVEVYGIGADVLIATLGRFGATDPVGRSFGVIKLRLDGADYDFSLPRRETKTAAGHRGFEVGVDPHLPVAEALARRDFTLNAIALDPFTGEIIDPHGGAADLARKTLRHTGPAFVEDPLRVLRAVQFAGRFGLSLAEETAALCREIVDTYPELPVERVWGEWEKWAANSRAPSAGLEVLRQSGWLLHFPEIAALIETPQDPEWHPEGDVFTHTALCCDALAGQPKWNELPASERRDLMLAVLAHDFGKPATTQQQEKHGRLRWTSPGHDVAGGPIADAFLARIGSPLAVRPLVRALVENHFAHLAWPSGAQPSEAYVRRLALRLAPASVRQLLLVLRADHLGRPPRLCAGTEQRITQLEQAAHAQELADAAPRPVLLGRHLLAAGLQPGPIFRTITDAAYEAQLDGAFADEPGALEWLRQHLAAESTPPA